jgi:hypothetical protein
MKRIYQKLLMLSLQGMLRPLEAFVFSFNKAKLERQRQKVITFAYSEVFFPCGQLRNRLDALQPPVRLN